MARLRQHVGMRIKTYRESKETKGGADELDAGSNKARSNAMPMQCVCLMPKRDGYN